MLASALNKIIWLSCSIFHGEGASNAQMYKAHEFGRFSDRSNKPLPGGFHWRSISNAASAPIGAASTVHSGKALHHQAIATITDSDSTHPPASHQRERTAWMRKRLPLKVNSIGVAIGIHAIGKNIMWRGYLWD